jgi:hypothetical protein
MGKAVEIGFGALDPQFGKNYIVNFVLLPLAGRLLC